MGFDMRTIFKLALVISTLTLILSLSGCATGRWVPPITQSDKFECEQKCGYYQPNMSVVFAVECANACYRAKNYYFQFDR